MSTSVSMLQEDATYSSRWGSAATPADVFDAPEAEVSDDQSKRFIIKPAVLMICFIAPQTLGQACMCAQATELFVYPFDIAGVSPLAWRELQVRMRAAHGNELSTTNDERCSLRGRTDAGLLCD